MIFLRLGVVKQQLTTINIIGGCDGVWGFIATRARAF